MRDEKAHQIAPTIVYIEKQLELLRGLPTQTVVETVALEQGTSPAPVVTLVKIGEKPNPVYAEPGHARIQALRMVCRRLEEFPNINAMQLFEELCIQFTGRFTRKQYNTLLRRISRWRQAARARGVVIGPKTYRRLSGKPRGRRPDIFKDHWEEMARCLEERPDQTAMELLVEFQVRYPDRYSLRQLYTLQSE